MSLMTYMLPTNDWFDIFPHQNQTFPESRNECLPFTFGGWSIKWNTFATVDYFRGKFIIHLREFIEKQDTYLLTKNGITMLSISWYYFSERLCEENLQSLEKGFDVNKDFFLSPVNEEDEYHLQFWTQSVSGIRVLNPKFFKIWPEQLIALSEISKHITTAILEGMYMVILPQKLHLEENLICLNQASRDWIEVMKKHIRQSLHDELSNISSKLANTLFIELVHNLSEKLLLLINMNTLAKCITSHPYFFT